MAGTGWVLGCGFNIVVLYIQIASLKGWTMGADIMIPFPIFWGADGQV
jgi:hypothetical protein